MKAKRQILMTAAGVACITLCAGLVSLLAGLPALFPSLGPSVVIQVAQPDQPSARFYHAFASQRVGLAAAFVFVAGLDLTHEPSVFAVGVISGRRVAAAVLGLGLAILLELILGAFHPPSASTTLLAALGTFKPVRCFGRKRCEFGAHGVEFEFR